MTKMLFLRPVTPVYFGKPGAMSAGENHIGVSWFPPPVSAFQGMIRTRLLDGAGVFSPEDRVAELVGPPDELPATWQLRGPFPARPAGNDKKEMQIWLPTPAFLLKPIDHSATRPVAARNLAEDDDDYLADTGAEKTGGSGRSFLHLQGQPRIAGEKPTGGWLSSRNLFHTLAGEIKEWDREECSAELPPFVEPENKTGLAREKRGEAGKPPVITGRADEGKLYTLEYLRFAPFTGLVGWFDGILSAPLSEKALVERTVIAGKKGGMIGFEPPPGPDPWWDKIRAGEHLDQHADRLNGKSVWLVLLSPGKWKNIPELEKILTDASGVKAQLNGCICPPASWLGGFSIARKHPRPAAAWYSAGTSLNVTFLGGNDRDLLTILKEKINNRCLLAPEQQRPFGYGHILVSTFLDNGEESHE